MQSTTQAAPAAVAANAIDPETLSSLFIADAALRRLCDCLTLVEGVPSLVPSHTVLHLIMEDISERVAECAHALLAGQAVQP